MAIGGTISGVLGMNMKSELFHQDEWLFDATAAFILVLCIATGAIMVCLLGGRSTPERRSKTSVPVGQELLTLDRPLSERPPTWQHGGGCDNPRDPPSSHIGLASSVARTTTLILTLTVTSP